MHCGISVLSSLDLQGPVLGALGLFRALTLQDPT